MLRYAVIGRPIAHSRSPDIHRAFAEQTGKALHYDRIEGSAEHFEQDVRRFFATGGSGLNVTLPFKERARAMADRVSVRAKVAGAANTLGMQGHDLWADNTDGIGLVRDLMDNLGRVLVGARVLMLGAGGAARGVVQPLAQAGVAALHIANRTEARARHLVEDLVGACPGMSLQHHAWQALDWLAPFDVVINATSTAVGGELPKLPTGLFASDGLAYDMGYGSEPTPFLRVAAEIGAVRLADGLGMLVEQAAAAFELWHDVRPDTKPVIDTLRA